MRPAIQAKMSSLIEQKQPGQSVQGFCEANNIGTASYYYWQKKFRQQGNAAEPAFIPIQVRTPKGGFALATIELQSGVMITVYRAEAFSFIQPLL